MSFSWQDKVEKVFPTEPILDEDEYKGEVFRIQYREGADFRDIVKCDFTARAITGDINAKLPIRFYAKVIGFEDIKAPMRNWGMNDISYLKLRYIKSRNIFYKGWEFLKDLIKRKEV